MPDKAKGALRVLTAGGAMADTIAIVDSERIERMTMKNAGSAFLLLEEGRKTEVSEISSHCGGGAVNAAVSLARLGHKAEIIAKLGHDERAQSILNKLEQEGVSTRRIVRDDRAPTGASVIIASHERNAAIFTFRGANTLIEDNDLPADAFKTDLVHVSNLSNASAERYPLILDLAKRGGAFVVANPGVRQLSAHGGTLLDTLKNVDVLAINAAEAAVLVPLLWGRYGEGTKPDAESKPAQAPRLLRSGLSSGSFDISLPRYFRLLHDLGLRCALVTDGKEGAYAALDGRIHYAPAAKVKVAGTAGAGDAFASTFGAFMAMREPVATALQAASLNAAGVLQHVDTLSGLLTKTELARKLQRQTDQGAQSWAL